MAPWKKSACKGSDRSDRECYRGRLRLLSFLVRVYLPICLLPCLLTFYPLPTISFFLSNVSSSASAHLLLLLLLSAVPRIPLPPRFYQRAHLPALSSKKGQKHLRATPVTSTWYSSNNFQRVGMNDRRIDSPNRPNHRINRAANSSPSE